MNLAALVRILTTKGLTPEDIAEVVEAAQKPDRKVKAPKVAQGVLVAVDPFDVWWGAYPRKVAKVAARKAWKAVPAKIGMEDLMELTRRFADHVVGKDPEHVAHPATWLNGERWNDELHPRSQTDDRRTTGIDFAADRASARLQAMVEGARIASVTGRRRWSL